METDSLQSFLGRIRSNEFISYAAQRCDADKGVVAQKVITYVNEVSTGLNLLSGQELRGKRILEVGAGLGALSIFLRSQGYDVVALEPGAGGFDLNEQICNALRTWLGNEDLSVLDIGAQELNKRSHGTFDFIFSVNVLEHIPDLASVISAMTDVLADDGRMVHTCPNYAVPYEPHYGIPLVPGIPRRTEDLVKALKGDPVWESLNFVTYADVKRLAAEAGLTIEFRTGQIYQAFRRLAEDREYGARHAGLVGGVGKVLNATGLVHLLKVIPPALATPMEFTCKKRGE